MTGGGFGGSAVVLLELGAVQAVSTAVATAFAAREYGTPEVIEVVACDGASRIA